MLTRSCSAGDLLYFDPTTGKELEGNNVEGVLVFKAPWPSIARTVYQDHQRYLDTYMRPYPGVFYTGDGAARDVNPLNPKYALMVRSWQRLPLPVANAIGPWIARGLG